ncbi:MAG: glutamate racemase [Bacilli bacterium]
MDKNSPIGVFDSGIGGLTVLESLKAIMPQENFIYLADDAFYPYGIKTKSEIENRVLEVGKAFIKKDVKAIVIACNTASANAQKLIKWAKITIQTVIEPTAFAAFTYSNTKKIALLATKLTVSLGTYQNILEEWKAKVYPLAASDLVDLAESPNRNSSETKQKVMEIVNPLLNEDFDTLILGCTHFGLLNEALKAAFPKVKLIACGEPTATKLKNDLIQLDLLTERKSNGSVELLCSRHPDFYQGKIDWLTFKHRNPRTW